MLNACFTRRSIIRAHLRAKGIVLSCGGSAGANELKGMLQWVSNRECAADFPPASKSDFNSTRFLRSKLTQIMLALYGLLCFWFFQCDVAIY